MSTNKLATHLGTMFAICLVTGCNGSQDPSKSAPAAAPKIEPIVEMKHLMKWVIEPQADLVWAAVGSISTPEGTKDIAPHTDEEWNAVRNSVAIVAETSNLLLMEGRSRGDDWNQKARALVETTKIALQATEAKDPEALFTAGGDMFLACTACHAVYLVGSEAATSTAKSK